MFHTVLPKRRTLGLFAKWPQAGHVKTRLAAETSSEWAAQVALACLRDSVERLAGIASRRILAFAPADAGDKFAGVVQDRFELRPQTEGNLGQRMAAFFASCQANGCDPVVL